MIVIVLTIYDLLIWIYRLFFRRITYLESRLKVIDPELAQKWPFKDSCIEHINEVENELLMRGRASRLQSRALLDTFSLINQTSMLRKRDALPLPRSAGV